MRPEHKELAEYLLSNSVIDENNCRLWTGSIYPSGYGKVRYGTEPVAHRAAYTAFIADIPAALLVLHKCDVRACINTEHLYIGTSIDNNRDTLKRHEAPRARGRMQGSAILTEVLVINIRKRLAKGIKPKIIAAEFSISYKTIISIKNKRTWGWLQDGPL